jgi:hypothetical protein
MDSTVSFWATPTEDGRWQLRSGVHSNGRYWESAHGEPLAEEGALTVLRNAHEILEARFGRVG